MTIHFARVVINTANKRVVIDAGNGPGEFVNSKSAVGFLIHNLAAAGIDAKMVDMVIISHFQGDHVNGLLTANGQSHLRMLRCLWQQAIGNSGLTMVR